MQGTEHALIALVAAYVRSEPLAAYTVTTLGLSGVSRPGIWGVPATVFRFLFLGMLSGWPISLLTGGTAALASWLEGSRGGAIRLLAVRSIARHGA